MTFVIKPTDTSLELVSINSTMGTETFAYDFDWEDKEVAIEGLKEMFQTIIDLLDMSDDILVEVKDTEEKPEKACCQEKHAVNDYDHDRSGRGGDTVAKLLHDLACKLSEKCRHGHRFSDHPACLREEMGLEDL